MERFILTLSKEDISLAETEAISILLPESHFLDENFLFIDGDIKFYQRLAYTKFIHKIIFECKKESLLNAIKDFNLNRVIDDEYCVRLTNSKDYSLKDVAAAVHSSLKNPRINLNNPKIILEFLFIGANVYCCEKIYSNTQNFNERKAHNRPELHPSSMHPKLARACVNLLGAREGSVVDPFCGSGGILIEAGVMGLRPVGYDIDEKMLRMARINLEHYKIKDYILELRDATKLSEAINFIVCDPPYGKNTKQKDIQVLYNNFISNLSKVLVKRAVVVYPDKINLKSILLGIKSLKIKNEFSIRVHKSLTRKIIILENV